jgi:hypothetical protein
VDAVQGRIEQIHDAFDVLIHGGKMFRGLEQTVGTKATGRFTAQSVCWGEPLSRRGGLTVCEPP